MTTSVTLAQQPSKDDAKLIQGTWTPLSAELNGKPLPEEAARGLKLTIQNDQYLVLVAGKEDQGTITLNLQSTPRGMDIKGTKGPNMGKTILAIYELNGDALKICYALDGKERPTEFKTRENSQLFLVLYKREKK